MLGAFGSGFLLALALIIPIGPQNLFIMESGLRTSARVVMWVVGTSAACDAVLIAVGTAGIGAVLGRIPPVRMALLAAGVVFLGYLGTRTLLSALSHEEHRAVALGGVGASSRRAARQAMAMSLLNPHAVLDTVGIIGVAAAAQQSVARPFFAGGAVAASIIWFTVIGFGTAALRHRLTSSVRRFIDRISGLVLLGFGAAFLVEFVHLAMRT